MSEVDELDQGECEDAPNGRHHSLHLTVMDFFRRLDIYCAMKRRGIDARQKVRERRFTNEK